MNNIKRLIDRLLFWDLKFNVFRKNIFKSEEAIFHESESISDILYNLSFVLDREQWKETFDRLIMNEL